MNKLRKTRKSIITIILVALLGTVLFFPVRYDSGKTCLFHRIFGGDEEHLPGQVPYVERAHEMLHTYLASYAAIWWFCLAMAALGIYLFLRKPDASSPGKLPDVHYKA